MFQYCLGTSWHVLFSNSHFLNLSGYIIVQSHVKLTKKIRVLVLDPWSAWHGPEHDDQNTASFRIRRSCKSWTMKKRESKASLRIIKVSQQEDVKSKWATTSSSENNPFSANCNKGTITFALSVHNPSLQHCFVLLRGHEPMVCTMLVRTTFSYSRFGRNLGDSTIRTAALSTNKRMTNSICFYFKHHHLQSQSR